MDAPKVSVITPAYNSEQYLRKCLESLCAQSLREIEILCINDGSTDATSSIMHEFEKNDPRVRVVDKENTGYGHSMNLALDMARGEYIAIVESDDYALRDMFRNLYQSAKTHQADFVKSDFYRFSGEGAQEVRILYRLTDDKSYYGRTVNPSQEPKALLLKMNTWTGLYRREFLNQHNIRHNETPGASYQDNGFWFQTFYFAQRARFVDTAYYMNRRDNENSSVYSKSKVYAMCEEYALIMDIMNAHPERKAAFLPYYMVKKLHNYEFTDKRVDDRYKAAFLSRFREEFLTAQREGYLEEAVFTPNEWQRVQALLSGEEEYRRYAEIGALQQQVSALNEEVSMIKNSLSFKVGRAVTLPLRKGRDMIRGFGRK